ncbi:TerD family protein [Kitasatospora sp. NPDC091207]|uniref:TerD family protein n=1 Tax=Kitasatospora sp. NPDC091207 TaxID=3364083 RepID=UPI00380C8F9D
MVKGANVGLAALSDSADSVIVSLGWSSPGGDGDADVSVLLLTAAGKVRGNAESGFIRSVDAAVERFHTSVIAHLDNRTARR